MHSLQKECQRIDGKSYKAYKDLQGLHSFSSYKLALDYVQGDPFASPSKIRYIIPRQETIISDEWFTGEQRRVTLEDHIARAVAAAIHKEAPRSLGTGKSGMIMIDAPGQAVLERTAVSVTDKEVTICLSIGLPAKGRRVLGQKAEQLFFKHLPAVLRQSVFALDADQIVNALQLTDQQQAIRDYMESQELVSFIGEGAVLPRESGISDKPLGGHHVVPFTPPESQAVNITVPHRQEPVRGMAIKQGITLIVGGGYHGKSTLLQAVERGVYNHRQGDGREFVLTDPTAMKIRAEDGRQVTRVDISPFIQNLPYGKTTEQFSSENASGSTSQAANIVEALEAGTQALLIDEDTSATNFMIRDSRMQQLVAKQKEPITPFIDKVKQLHDDYQVSTVLVMGGSGDYFDVADTVIMMEQYQPYDVTDEARAVARDHTTSRQQEGGARFGSITHRQPLAKSLNSHKGKKEKVTARGLTNIQYGTTNILLDQVEQLIDQSQTRSIAAVLHHVEKKGYLQKQYTLKQLLAAVEKQMNEQGLASFAPFPKQHPGDLARPRSLELAAALNRLRTLHIHS